MFYQEGQGSFISHMHNVITITLAGGSQTTPISGKHYACGMSRSHLPQFAKLLASFTPRSLAKRFNMTKGVANLGVL